jgi:hypothetical protein
MEPTMPPTSDTVTILFLAANPVDTDRLRLGEELRDIKAALRQATHRDRFDAQDEWAVRIDDLRRALLRYKDKPLVVHFSGHGEAGAIFLEGRDGQTKPVEGDALSHFLKLFPNIQCVILNACYSDELADALAKVVPCVVGMQAAVTDSYAVLFAVALYDGIGEGLSYADAYAIAESSLGLEGGLDAVCPVFKPGKVAPPSPPPPPNGGNGDPAVHDDGNHPAEPRLVVPQLDDITGKQQGELADALIAAFGDKETLRRMVRTQLDKNLDAIAGGSDLQALTFDLVGWAKRSGYLRELVQAAVDAQPRNHTLRAFALSVGAGERVNG